MKLTTEQAILRLREQWTTAAVHIPDFATNPNIRISSARHWNEICDVLGFADRFKL